jgi:hypothetical protein
VWLALSEMGELFLNLITMRRRIKSKKKMVWTTSFKPRETDKRYKDGVDTGRFSNNTVPLPLKTRVDVLQQAELPLDIPKQVIRQKEANRHFKNQNKTNMERKHYSRKETKQLRVLIDENNSSTKPLSLRQLSLRAAKELNRKEFGIYNKMLKMCVQKPQYQKSARKQAVIAQPTMQQPTQKSVSFGRPTKIDITETGMTFYF